MKTDRRTSRDFDLGRKQEEMSLYTVFTTAFQSACVSMEVEENTVLREKVWAAMNGDASPAIPAVPSTPPRLARHTAEPPGAPKRAKKEEVEELAESVSKLDLGEDEKLTPIQKIEKQLAATQEKLDKVRARQGTKKQTAKQKETDPAEIAKLEAKIPELQTKIEKEKLKSGGGKKEEKPKENFPKWTPSAKNLTLANAERVGTTVDDAVQFAVKHWLNGMTADEFKAKKIDAHIAEYFNGLAKPLADLPEGHIALPPVIKREAAATEAERVMDEIDEVLREPPAQEDEENQEVKLDGKVQLVGTNSTTVFEAQDDGDVRVRDPEVIRKVVDAQNAALKK